MSRRTMRDYVMQAFFARDKASLAKIADDAEKAMARDQDHEEPDGDEGKHASSGNEGGVHVHIEHKPQNGCDDDTTDSGKLVDRVSRLETGMQSLQDSMTKVLDAVSGRARDEGELGERNTGSPTPPEDSGQEGDLVMTDPPPVDAELMEADPVPEQERMRMGDAAYTARRATGLIKLKQDVLARAEVLSPGIKSPTWDSAPDGKQLAKQLCALRRSALLKAAESDSGAAVLGNYAATVRTMSCDALRFVFRDASDKMRAFNNERSKPSPMFGDQTANMRGYRNAQTAIIAGINKQNQDFWSSRIASTRH